MRFCDGVALHPAGLLEGLLELLLGDVAVIALELLLGAQLDAEIGHLALAALAVLAGSIFAAVDRALGTSEDVFAHAAVELILGAGALGHRSSSNSRCRKFPDPHRRAHGLARSPLHRGAGSIAKGAPSREALKGQPWRPRGSARAAQHPDRDRTVRGRRSGARRARRERRRRCGNPGSCGGIRNLSLTGMTPCDAIAPEHPVGSCRPGAAEQPPA